MWPFKKRKKQVTPSVGGVAPVIIINDSIIVHEILGITEERAITLYEKIESLIFEQKDTVKVMIEYSKFCLHQNEFAFGVFMLKDTMQTIAMKHALKEVFGK